MTILLYLYIFLISIYLLKYKAIIFQAALYSKIKNQNYARAIAFITTTMQNTLPTKT